jgi:Fe-S-cluster containining protein
MIRLVPTRGEVKSDPAWATASIQLKLDGEPLWLEISVPRGPTSVRNLLPVFEGLTNAVVDVAVRRAEGAGKTISCRAGCGACCRQLVPISGAEAHHLAQLVAALPELRQSQGRARFAKAGETLAKAGLLEQLHNPGPASGKELRPVGLAYFALGIPCPFLEDESCSIHLDRPLACREYLVTSPAEHCSRPTPKTVHCVPMPVKVSNAVRGLDKPGSNVAAGWLPLTLALEWAAAHPEVAPTRAGPALLHELFAKLTNGDVPETASPANPADVA